MRTRPSLSLRSATPDARQTTSSPSGIDMSRIPPRLHATVTRAEAVARAARGEAPTASYHQDVITPAA